MRRRTIQPPGSALEAINVTPMIDVVMCLIIFFLIVGKLSSDRGVLVPLPQSIRGTEETSPTVLVVTIARLAGSPPEIADAAAGWKAFGVTVQADGQPMADAKALESLVRGRLAEAPGLSIQVRGDRALPYGAVEPVLRACGQAGAKSVRFAAERDPAGGAP